MAEKFIIKLNEVEDTGHLSPVLYDDGISYIYIQYSNLYLLALTHMDVNVESIIIFLHKLVDIFKQYFTEVRRATASGAREVGWGGAGRGGSRRGVAERDGMWRGGEWREPCRPAEKWWRNRVAREWRGRGGRKGLARLATSLPPAAFHARFALGFRLRLAHLPFPCCPLLPQLEEESLRDNFVIAYELLDEVRADEGQRASRCQ